MSVEYKICLNESLMSKGIELPVIWDAEKYPHMALSGGTGTGKTVFSKVIVNQILSKSLDCNITICDFKGDDDFSFLNGYSKLFRFEAVKTGVDDFYNSFVNRQKGEESRTPTFLLFDEWASFLNYCEKKESEAYKQKLASLLMLGRSFNVHVILSQQRLDAESFSKSRDNFSMVVVLGNPSKEVVGMLFSEYKESISNDRERGTGYLLIAGSKFLTIRVPVVKDINQLNSSILAKIQKFSELP